MAKILTRDEILTADDMPIEEVPTPEWAADSAVRVRALTAAEWIEVGRLTMTGTAGATDDQDMLELMIRIPVLCIIDEHGKQIFSNADIEALGKKNPLPLKRIMDVVQRLSNLDGIEQKKD